MRLHPVLGITLILAALILVKNVYSESRIPMPPLTGVTRIEFVDNLNRPIKSISDAAQIRSIIAFVNSRRMKWTKPFPDTPVPVFVANFYAGSKFIGHFGAGKTFFETQCQDGFCSQKATGSEIKEFLRLAGETESILERP